MHWNGVVVICLREFCAYSPMGGSGSSCAGCHDSRPRDVSQSPESSAQKWNTNCGPQSETTSYGMPKGLWKRASAVSRAVGTP